ASERFCCTPVRPAAATQPFTQYGLVPEQTAPHPPQFAASCASSDSQPVAGSPSQSEKPAAHEVPHDPPPHAAAPLSARGQALTQVRQWTRSVARLVSQPSARPPLQLAKPVAQAAPQTPEAQ